MYPIQITYIDTACVLININGFRILTDPTLDKAGQLYYHGSGAFSRKLDNPAINITELNHIDLVLLSHHQHKDNFDQAGKSIAEKAGLLITTKPGAANMNNAIGLSPWESYTMPTSKLGNLVITATPAQHRPSWIPEWVSGKVIGFVLSYPNQKKGVLYISGDTVYFSGIKEIAARFKINIGIFHLGSVQFRYLTGFGRYTMNTRDLIKASQILNPNEIVPVHYRGWSHFKESETSCRKQLADHPSIQQKIHFLPPGIPTTL